MTEATASPPPPPPPPGLPPQPPPLARAIALDLVTRYRLRLADPRDSRLGALGGDEYQLAAAGWTGQRSAFVGFYTPPADPSQAGPDLARRCESAAAWGGERLSIQGAERSDVLIVALGPVPGTIGVPVTSDAVHVGAVAVDGTGPDAVAVAVLPTPPGLPTAREIRSHAQMLRQGAEAPSLAAVDLAERQAVAGGYAAPARAQLRTTPVATYALIASFVAVFIVEKLLIRGSLGSSQGLFDMGAVSNVAPDWWRFISYAFLHDPGGGGGALGTSSLPLHIIFNSFAMYIVGRLVEQLYGWRVLLATFLVTAAGAAAASVGIAAATGSDVLTIGASGGIMGLLGLLFVLGRFQGRDVPVGLARGMRQYALTYAAMVIVFGFIVPNVDNVAHVGGFITGALVGAALPPLRHVGGRDLKRWEQVGVYAVYGVAALALVFAVVNTVSLLGTSTGLNTGPA